MSKNRKLCIMKIYTKTGDDGTTSLVGGTRVSKADVRLEAYGTADELNSFVGLLRAYELPEEADDILNMVQNRLFNIGACLATETDKHHFVRDLQITEEDICRLERAIDSMNDTLPVIRSFILPAGNKRVCLAHVCRTVTRRLERRMVETGDEYESAKICLQFVNRLSDYFFVLSKKMAQTDQCDVFLWRK